MTGLADRMPMLVELRGENRRVIRENAADHEKDKYGSCSSMLALDLRFFGVADYFLNRNVESFRSQLSEAAELRIRMFERYERGEPLDASYVTMLSYKELFNALAAANLPIAKSLAQHMGGRHEIEKQHDHPFDYAMGYTLRTFVLDDFEKMKKWTAALAAACRDTNMNDFDGYVQVFEAMLSGDAAIASHGLSAIVAGHKRQRKGKGVFVNTEDEVLCVWGVGLANLARSRGVLVEGVPPLIPGDLLV
jgi:hypothetical protein